MKELSEDTGISFVCQLFAITDKEALTYCDNRVYVELNTNNTDSLKNAAMLLGFYDLQPDMGSNRYWLNYKSKIIDERFFEAYKKLTETRWVLSAYMSTHFEPVLDDSIRPMETKE